jgi:hypothetical protein
MMERRRPSTRFVVTFIAGHGADNSGAIRSLRAVLKNALRRHGLRAIDIREESVPPPDVSNQIAGAFGQLRHDVRNRLRDQS